MFTSLYDRYFKILLYIFLLLINTNICNLTIYLYCGKLRMILRKNFKISLAIKKLNIKFVQYLVCDVIFPMIQSAIAIVTHIM